MTRFNSCKDISTALLLVALWSCQVSGSVISASKASTTNFELQTNLVSCGADSSSGSTGENESGSAGSSNSALCLPPESKLFGNIKVVEGTPHPGPTGVRGRLYDVGTLCDAKVAEKIDRAWIAFLDCSGCSLETKMANLENSNPQAILIYNQTSCVFPASTAPAPATLLPPSQTNAATPSPTPAQGQPAPATPATPASTTAAAAPAETKPAEATPDNENQGGEDPEEGKEDPEDGHDNDTDRVKHPRVIKIPRRHLVEHAHRPNVVRRAIKGAASDPSEAFFKSSTTIAMAEQVTIDYLFHVLSGPASFAPLPAALKSLKTIVHQQALSARVAEEDGDDSPPKNANTITDLMVSISPAFGDSGSGEKKFLSMSKPIFATVVGVLSALVCGVVLMYVVRPLIRRNRKKDPGHDDVSVERGDYNQGHGGDGGQGAYAYSEAVMPGLLGVGSEPELAEKYRPSIDWGNTNTAPATQDLTMQPQGEDDLAYAQQRLSQLRQEEDESSMDEKNEFDTVAPNTVHVAPVASKEAPQPDEQRSGLPQWRQSTMAAVPEEERPSREADRNEVPLNESALPSSSSRNGSNLFEWSATSRDDSDKPSALLLPINTSMTSKEGGLATALYRQRMSLDAGTPRSFQPVQSPGAGGPQSATPRASFSDDFPSNRASMDSYRRDIQLRFGEITNSSRASISGTPRERVSFSDDFPSNSRPSLDALRSYVPPGQPLATEVDGLQSSTDQAGARGSSNIRRESSSGI